MNNFDLFPLFVFDLANNHMGNLDHGLKIMREIHQVTSRFDFNFGFKFQYRHLDTFIHPDYKGRNDIKYVKRFSETRLTEDQFKRLKGELDNLGFISICTPFDEKSVDLIEEQGIKIIKIASCSFTDWPLLERIVQTQKPIIASTAGSTFEEIDKVVSFFEHRDKQLSIMHCVAEYPTPNDKLQLNQIDIYKKRYPKIPIGYSTHENPENIDAIKIAIAKGASIFEKHVGIKTDQYNLNAYSATPEQIEKWLLSAKETFVMCGVVGKRLQFTKKEKSSLQSLQRGIFSRRTIKKGEQIEVKDLFFAIPTVENQLTANDVTKYTEYYAEQEIQVNQPILFDQIKKTDVREKVYEIVQEVKDLLHKSNIVVPGKSEFEISHHYGLEKFKNYGTTLITVVNREYCKKLIVMLPRQKHPEQFHKEKEETFVVQHGKIQLSLNGQKSEHKVGDLITINPGVKHAFSTETGTIIEEISSTHYKNDSYYTDDRIMKNNHRKTYLSYWLN